jgi:hypothetical protein
MSAAPGPAEPIPPRDPDDGPPPRVLSGAFWVMMLFCGLCLISAVVVGFVVPRLFVVRTANAAAPVSVPLAGPARSAKRAAPDHPGPL